MIYIYIYNLIVINCEFSCSNWFESKSLDNLYILIYVYISIITKIHCSENGKQFYFVYILFFYIKKKDNMIRIKGI